MIKIVTSGDYIQLKYVDTIEEYVQEELKSDSDAVECSYGSNGRIYLKFGRMTFDYADPTEFEIDGSAVTDAADFVSKFNALFSFSGGSPSGGDVTEVTYSELAALIDSSGLTVGGQYLITDFKTVHFIVDADGTQYTDSIIEGDLEPLIVTATATDKLYAVAKSTTFPQDIIHIDFNENNWVDDLAFSNHDASPVIITGWKGTIYFRHDTLYDNYIGYDFRNCKFRRWKTNVDAWSAITTYDRFAYVTHSNKIYRSLQNTNTNNQPDISEDFWTPALDLSQTLYWNPSPGSFNQITSHSDFDDFKTFVEGSGSATYAICVRGNHFGSFKDTDSFNNLVPTILNNNVFFLQDDSFYTIYDNVVGPNFCNNTIGYKLRQMVIGSDCGGNQIGELNDSFFTIAGNNKIFQANASIFGPYLTNNVIGNGFLFNTVGTNFNLNTIGNNCFSNTFGNGFGANRIKNGFTMNTAEDNLGDGIDFTGGTHVYASYNTRIFKRADGTVRLSYVDNSDVLTIVAATA